MNQHRLLYLFEMYILNLKSTSISICKLLLAGIASCIYESQAPISHTNISFNTSSPVLLSALPDNLLIILCLYCCSSIQQRMLSKATLGSLIRLNLGSTCLIGLIPTKAGNQQHMKCINTSSPNYTNRTEGLARYSSFCTQISRSTLACTQVYDQANTMKSNSKFIGHVHNLTQYNMK